MEKYRCIDIINQMFPAEASLSGVEPFMQKIHNEIRLVDATILAAVRQQSSSGSKAKDDLAYATHAAEELSHKVQEMKSISEQTEAIVHDMRDIKKLDFAKKNVTTAITALHRLTMLVSAVEQLQVMTSKRQYKEAAAQLKAVNELCNHFEAYMDVTKITELREKFQNIKKILKSHIFSDFSSLGTGTETEENLLLKKLSDSCLVVDALEPSVREELVNNFCSRELTLYEQICIGAELQNLNEIERIYNQINFQIQTNLEQWKIFPASWHVPYRLCIQLCKKTREKVESILVNLKEKPDVEKLLLELERTLEFEMELEMKFGGGGGSIGHDIKKLGEGGNNSQNISEIHVKYEDKFAANQESGENEKTRNKYISDPGARINFRGMISSCFEPHLTIYIEKKGQELIQLLEKVVQEETWDIEDESQNNILSSSLQLFSAIEKSLTRCSALTRNQTLFNLFKVFQRILKFYATKLFLKIPKGATSIIAAATGMDGEIKVSDRDERMICYIVNSAEYCHKTSGELAKEVSTIINPHYAYGVDMSEVQDEFSSVITKALVTLVRGLETKFDSKMLDMTRVPWGTLKSVGDQSKYIYGINTILSSSIPVLGNLLTPVHFQFFLDKLALSLGQRFYANIFRCKQISETGAQQMLVDTHAMKMILLEVPSLAKQIPTGSYFDFVNHQIRRAEAVLKVIPSPIISVVDTYHALFPKGTAVEFQRILEVKGLTKAEQRSILDDFSNHGPGSTQPSVTTEMPQPPAPSLEITNLAAAVGFITNSEEVLTRAAVLGKGAATTSFRKLYALTEAAKDRPFRKLFIA